MGRRSWAPPRACDSTATPGTRSWRPARSVVPFFKASLLTGSQPVTCVVAPPGEFRHHRLTCLYEGGHEAPVGENARRVPGVHGMHGGTGDGVRQLDLTGGGDEAILGGD